MGPGSTIHLKRAYEEPGSGDGRRILVERLWPRGLRKERAALDAWMKDVAPSAELRRWYAHDFARWPEFQRRYRAELDANPGAVAELRKAVAAGPVTFVFAARDPLHSSAMLLRDYLLGGRSGE